MRAALKDVGLPEDAVQLIDSPDRALVTELLEARGQVDQAAAQMTDVVQSGSEQAPTALIDLVENRWLDRATIAPDVPDLIAGYVGQTAIQTAEAIKKTVPGVLFIDGRYVDTLSPGRHLKFDEPTPMANLHLAMIRRMGAKADRFSDSEGELAI